MHDMEAQAAGQQPPQPKTPGQPKKPDGHTTPKPADHKKADAPAQPVHTDATPKPDHKEPAAPTKPAHTEAGAHHHVADERVKEFQAAILEEARRTNNEGLKAELGPRHQDDGLLGEKTVAVMMEKAKAAHNTELEAALGKIKFDSAGVATKDSVDQLFKDQGAALAAIESQSRGEKPAASVTKPEGQEAGGTEKPATASLPKPEDILHKLEAGVEAAAKHIPGGSDALGKAEKEALDASAQLKSALAHMDLGEIQKAARGALDKGIQTAEASGAIPKQGDHAAILDGIMHSAELKDVMKTMTEAASAAMQSGGQGKQQTVEQGR
jgi:hypothetical protein